MGDGSGRVISLSGRGAIPIPVVVLWIGVTEPLMVRLLTKDCLKLTDRIGWAVLGFVLKSYETMK